MNAAEQRNHKRRTDELTDGLEALAKAFDERIVEVLGECRAMVGAERTHRLKLADEQRSYVDAADRQMALQMDGAAKVALAHTVEATEVLRRGFWSRLNWLLTGR